MNKQREAEQRRTAIKRQFKTIMSSAMPQLYLPCRHVSDVHKIPSGKCSAGEQKRFWKKNTQVHVSPRTARFSLYRILLLFTASMWGGGNRWRSFVPAPEPCTSQRSSSVYCAPKKAITMLMCRSRRVKPDVRG